MKYRKRISGVLALLLLMTAMLFVPSSVAATPTSCVPDAGEPLKCFCEEVNRDTSGGKATVENKKICEINSNSGASSSKSLLAKEGIVKKILNFMSWLTGLLAAVYLIVGGFKIIVSGGESDSVASGRKMIIYAMVGIAVVISSNLIINLVIGAVNNASK